MQERDRLLMLTPAMPAQHGNGLAMRLGFFLSVYAEFRCRPHRDSGRGHADGPNAFVQSRARRVDVVALDRPDTHFGLVMGVRDLPDRLEAFGNYGRPSLARFNGSAERAMAAFTRDIRYAAVHVSRLYLAELARPWIDDRRRRCPVVLDCDDDDISAYQRLAAVERRTGNLFAASWADLEAGRSLAWRSSGCRSSTWRLRPRIRRSGRCRSTGSAGSRLRMSSIAVSPRMPADASPPLYSSVRSGTRPTRTPSPGSFHACGVDCSGTLHFRVRLLIVGRDPSSAVMRLRSQRGIELAGNVPDVGPLYRDADLAIAPLRAGGGTRIKIIEAAAHGVPIIATRLAAEGIRGCDGDP